MAHTKPGKQQVERKSVSGGSRAVGVAWNVSPALLAYKEHQSCDVFESRTSWLSQDGNELRITLISLPEITVLFHYSV